MKKKIIFSLGFLIVLFLAASLLSTNENKDLKVREFTGEFNTLTVRAVEKIGSPPQIQGIREAQQLVDEKMPDLQIKFAQLKQSGDMRVSALTAEELDKSLENNSSQIKNIYNQYLTKTYDDLEQLNKAKEQYASKMSKKAWKDVEAKSNVLRENVKLLNELEKLVNGFRLIQKSEDSVSDGKEEKK